MLKQKKKIGRRSQGTALLLVLIAVAVCTIMALSFLAAQGPSAAIATNIDRKAKARAVAESALQMAIDYVNEDADWRSAKSSGQWISAASLDGGTFDLYGIDEDGDLADDDSDLVTLSVVATYEGVTHRVSARMTVQAGAEANTDVELCFVVANHLSLTTEETFEKNLYESWGFSVVVIDDDAASIDYDAAIAASDCVMISSDANRNGSTVEALRSEAIGVVFDLFAANITLRVSGNAGATSYRPIVIEDNTHYITSPFELGTLDFSSSSMLTYNTSSVATGSTALARDSSGSNSALIVTEVGGELTFGSPSTAPGRRVTLPWSRNTDNLNDDGKLILRRSIEWAAQVDAAMQPSKIVEYDFEESNSLPQLVGWWKLDEGLGGGDQISVAADMTLRGNSYIDSFDSAMGAYGGTNQRLDVRMLTNAGGSGDIRLFDNSILYGDIATSSSGWPASFVVRTSGSAQVTGSLTQQSSNFVVPTVNAPTGFGASSGSQTYTGGSHTWSDGDRFDHVTLESGATVTISDDTEVWVRNNLNLNDGDIVLLPGAKLTLWVGGHIEIQGGSTLNDDTTRAADVLVLQYSSSGNFTIENGVAVGRFHVPGDLSLAANSHLYGSTIVGENLGLESGGAIHLDVATAPPYAPGTYDLGVVTDDSPTGNHGSAPNSPTPGIQGSIGGAFEFNGSSNYVMIPHDEAYLLKTGSIAAWFYCHTLTGLNPIVSKSASGTLTGGLIDLHASGNKVRLEFKNIASDPYGTGTSILLESTGLLSANTWHHAVATWGDGEVRLYLDGVLVDSAFCLYGLDATNGDIGNEQPIAIGGGTNNSNDGTVTPLSSYFDGAIDDVRIYNQPLDQAQVTNLAGKSEAGSRVAPDYRIRDVSGFSDPLDLVILDTSAITWLTGGGLRFDSNTSAVSPIQTTKLHDAIEAQGEFAIELLLTPAASGGTASPSRIVSYAESSSNHNFMFGQDGTRYEARVRDTSTGNNGALSPEFIAGTSLSGSADKHVVLSYQGGQVSVFVDGVLDETQTAGGVLNNWDPDHFLVFGGAYGGGSHWLGTLKRVAIYDRALNAIQAGNVFNGNAPGTGASGAGGSTVQWDELD